MSVLFSEFLINVANFLGTTTTLAGIFLSLLLTVGFTTALLIAISGANTRGDPTMLGLISFVFFTITFTAMGWYPVWTGSILAFAIALLGAFFFSKIGKGA